MASRKVLVADDDNDFAEQMLYILNKKHKYLKIDIASDGVEAMKLALTRKYNCIITDVNMPELTGPEFIKTIRLNKSNFGTPVIFVSGEGNVDWVKNIPFSNLVAKPFHRNDFLELFEQQLALRSDTNRLCGVVFDLLLDELGEELNKYLDDKTTFSELSTTVGKSLNTDFCVRLELNINSVFNTIIFCLNSELLEAIKEKLSYSKVRHPDVAVHLITQVRKKFLSKYDFPTVKFDQIRTYKDVDVKSLTQKVKGLEISLTNSSHKISVLATPGKVKLKAPEY